MHVASRTRSRRVACVPRLPFPLRFEGRWQVVLKRAHFCNALSLQLELNLYDRGNHVCHMRHLPRATCESPFAALDQIWHVTRLNDAAAEQIESGFAHFTLSDNDVNLTYNDRFTLLWPGDFPRGELVHVSSLWKEFVRQLANAVNRATNSFFLVRGGFYVVIDDGWPSITAPKGCSPKAMRACGNITSIHNRRVTVPRTKAGMDAIETPNRDGFPIAISILLQSTKAHNGCVWGDPVERRVLMSSCGSSYLKRWWIFCTWNGCCPFLKCTLKTETLVDRSCASYPWWLTPNESW